MAEYASAIIGLIAIGAKVSNSLHTLIETFNDAPNQILALSDETNNFRAMLISLSEVVGLEEWTQEEHDAARAGLKKTVTNGQHIIWKIEVLIKNVRQERLGKNGEAQVNRLQWLRMAKKAKKLKSSDVSYV